MSGYWYNMFFVIRRILLALSIAFISSNPYAQIFIQVLMSMAQLCYILKVRPYELPLDNNFDVANEMTVLAVYTMSIRFADGAPEPLVAGKFGFVIIAVILLNIAANMAYFMYVNF